MMRIPSRSSIPCHRAAAFTAGIVAVAVAVALDGLSTAVLSAHMTQHLLLTVVAPPLLVWSRPDMLVRRLVPLSWRVAARRSTLGHAAAHVLHVLTHPVMGWVLLCAPFILWHLPGPYEWMRQSEAAHVLALASFFAGALTFWACVIGRSRRRQAGSALLLVTAAAAATSLPGALLSFAPRLVYRGLPDPFAICGLTAMEDQHLAGLIMWIPMDAILLAAAGWLFVAWLREAERRVSLRARQVAAVSSLLLLGVLLAGCQESETAAVPGGDARRGAALTGRYGCGACHVIPGIAEANGLVGPPLNKMGRRVYIAGVLRNSPDNMMIWLQDPQRIVPGNAMPNMGIRPDEARDLTAYLYTLR